MVFSRNRTDANDGSRIGKLIGGAIRGVGCIYLILGVLKLDGLLFPTATMQTYLTLSNPVLFFLKNSVVFYAVAVAEIIIGGYLAIARKSFFKYILLFWMLSAAICYRLCLMIMDYHGPCGCLLGVNHFLPMSSSLQNTIADIILLMTLAFTLGSLILEKYFNALFRKKVARSTPSQSP